MQKYLRKYSLALFCLNTPNSIKFQNKAVKIATGTTNLVSINTRFYNDVFCEILERRRNNQILILFYKMM